MRGAERREQDHEASDQPKQKHELHRFDHLIHHALDLLQQSRHIDDHEVGKALHQLVHQWRLIDWKMEAGDIAHREWLENARWTDDEEVDPKRIPLHFAQRRDLAFEAAARDFIGETIVELDT